MTATQISPDPTRAHFIAAIEAADKLLSAAALTRVPYLMEVCRTAQREAWVQLEEFDKRARYEAAEEAAREMSSVVRHK